MLKLYQGFVVLVFFLLLTMLQGVKVILHSKIGTALGLSMQSFIAFW